MRVCRIHVRQKRETPITPEELRDGIFALFTRRFGTVAELLIKRMQGLAPARAQFHDLFDDLARKRVEVKFSRVLNAHEGAITEANVLAAIEAARAERKAVPVEDAEQEDYDCNIQQVKRSEFDVLYYGLFFRNRIVVFRVASADVAGIPGYSDKQHKGNVGEGQFHISAKTYAWHRANRLYTELTYEQLLTYLAPA
jgi:hypothetical protein